MKNLQYLIFLLLYLFLLAGNIPASESRIQPYLGIQLQELNPDLAEYFNVKPDQGLLVVTVIAESPADKSGIKAGDIIMELDGIKVQKSAEIREMLNERKADDKITILLVRHGKEKTVNAVLAKHKALKKLKVQKIPPFIDKDIEIEIPDIDFDDLNEKLLEKTDELKDLENRLDDLRIELENKKRYDWDVKEI